MSDAGWNAAAFDGLQLIKLKNWGAETAWSKRVRRRISKTAFATSRLEASTLFSRMATNILMRPSTSPAISPILISWSVLVVIVDECRFADIQDRRRRYVEGVIAGGVSKSGVAGAIGGIELPSIKFTFDGFKRGFLSVQPNGRSSQLYRQVR